MRLYLYTAAGRAQYGAQNIEDPVEVPDLHAVEMLNSGTGRPLSILHHAKGTAVYAQMRELCFEVLDDLGLSDRLPALAQPSDEPDELWGAPAGGDREPWRRR